MKTNPQAFEKEICAILKRVAPQITEQTLREIKIGKSITDLKIIDSLNLVALLCELESVFGVKLEPEDVNIANFETLPKIIKVLRAKIQ